MMASLQSQLICCFSRNVRSNTGLISLLTRSNLARSYFRPASTACNQRNGQGRSCTSVCSGYTYKPLPTNDSIRLLKITKNADNSEPISVCLKSFQYSKIVNDYKALSYTWSAPYGTDQEDQEDYSSSTNVSERANDYSIVCNGSYLSVARNLLEAMFRLRYNGEEDWFWIDAICINQADEGEKALQIGMMGDLYAGASMVVVWLGILDLESEKAVKFILERQRERESRERHKLQQSQSQSVHVKAEDQTGDTTSAEADQKPDGFSTYELEEWRFLRQFFHRRWFRRVWIVQEIALARDEIALCGSLQFKMNDILRFAHMLSGGDLIRFSGESQLLSASDYHRKNVFEMEQLGARFPAQLLSWTQISWEPPPGVRTVLHDHRCVEKYLEMSFPQKLGTWFEVLIEQLSHREVSHRIDIVFAAFNLISKIAPVTDTDRSKMMKAWQLDYNRPAAHNYISLTGGLLGLTDGLGVLSLVDSGAQSSLRETTCADLPSWVPNLDKPLSSSRLLAQDFDASTSLGAGDPISNTNFGSTVFLGLDSGTVATKSVHLALKGVILGSIMSRSTSIAAADTESWCTTMSHLSGPDWSLVYQDRTPMDVLARTLCAANEGGRFKTTDSTKRAALCESFILKLLGEAFLQNFQNEGEADSLENFWASRASTMSLLEDFSVMSGQGSRSVLQSITTRLAIDDILLHQPELASVFCSLRQKWGLPSELSAEDSKFAMLRKGLAAMYSRLLAPFAERGLFKSSSGHLGLSPRGAETGDLVVFVQKGRLPFVVRPVKGYAGVYTLVGDAYVDGLMYGEVGNLGLHLEDITLV